MSARRWTSAVWLVLLMAAVATTACRRTYAVVPRPSGGYRPDTLRAVLRGDQVFVIFRFDTVTHTRTVVVTDTLWKEGTRIITDTLRIVRRDTVRLVRRDTLRLVRSDTVRVPVLSEGTRVDTVRRTDTVYVNRQQMVASIPVDTVRVFRTDTVRLTRTDTVRLTRTDTVRIVRTDTVRIAGTTTDRGAGKQRTLQVPPGHYPPEGLCRVWIQGVPPGRQRDPAPCDKLVDIPAGAFILFGSEAWDFDYDWVAESRSRTVPPQIIALKRKP